MKCMRQNPKNSAHFVRVGMDYCLWQTVLLKWVSGGREGEGRNGKGKEEGRGEDVEGEKKSLIFLFIFYFFILDEFDKGFELYDDAIQFSKSMQMNSCLIETHIRIGQVKEFLNKPDEGLRHYQSGLAVWFLPIIIMSAWTDREIFRIIIQ